MHRHHQCFSHISGISCLEKGFPFPETPFFVQFIDFLGIFFIEIC